MQRQAAPSALWGGQALGQGLRWRLQWGTGPRQQGEDVCDEGQQLSQPPTHGAVWLVASHWGGSSSKHVPGGLRTQLALLQPSAATRTSAMVKILYISGRMTGATSGICVSVTSRVNSGGTRGTVKTPALEGQEVWPSPTAFSWQPCNMAWWPVLGDDGSESAWLRQQRRVSATSRQGKAPQPGERPSSEHGVCTGGGQAPGWPPKENAAQAQSAAGAPTGASGPVPNALPGRWSPPVLCATLSRE